MTVSLRPKKGRRPANNTALNRTCLTCGEALRGRSDKKFCDDYCRSAHNNGVKHRDTPVIRKVNRVLLQNRKILADSLGAATEITVPKAALLQKGFAPHYLTHWEGRGEGEVVCGCYEFGYRFGPEDCTIFRQT